MEIHEETQGTRSTILGHFSCVNLPEENSTGFTAAQEDQSEDEKEAAPWSSEP